ncbi:glycosyltransferase [Pontibacter sp. HSC-14F20]|uniref:glycosyltransferase family 2 protein n=1 Tax=Pontibacter sp. HSC-14F20 TaxID=2864136 RepID=UPI001C72E892|nr:glycosyltransferase family 2 protein [Pontibacter sp. HSC-14F20]MBX0332374.1 glycosyltransferase [Pontibacter sp. HSC-14F20]
MFSIIIPLYNKEASIAETLHTVLDQTFTAYEVIVVNDGSTDQSLSIVQSFDDRRIKVYTKKNGGVSDARNYGIERANYDYIAFLDADDTWDSNYLEEMNKMIEKYPDCGMYNCAYRAVKGDRIFIESPNISDGVIEDYFKATLTLDNMISWTSATIIKKEVTAVSGLFPVGMVSGEDSFMWCKVAMHYPVAYTHKIMATYNMMMSGAFGRIAKPDSCKESWSDLYSNHNHYLNKFIAYKAVENGLRHAWAGQKRKSRLIERQLNFARKHNDRYFKQRFIRLFCLNRTPQFAVNILLLYKKLVTIRFFGPPYFSICL